MEEAGRERIRGSEVGREEEIGERTESIQLFSQLGISDGQPLHCTMPCSGGGGRRKSPSSRDRLRIFSAAISMRFLL